MRFFDRSERRAREEFEAARKMSQQHIAWLTLSLAERFRLEASLGEDDLPGEKTRALVSAKLEEQGEEPITVDEVSRGIGHDFWSDAEWASTFSGYVEGETRDRELEGLATLFGRPGTIIKIGELYSSDPSLLHPLILREAERVFKPV